VPGITITKNQPEDDTVSPEGTVQFTVNVPEGITPTVTIADPNNEPVTPTVNGNQYSFTAGEDDGEYTITATATIDGVECQADLIVECKDTSGKLKLNKVSANDENKIYDIVLAGDTKDYMSNNYLLSSVNCYNNGSIVPNPWINSKNFSFKASDWGGVEHATVYIDYVIGDNNTSSVQLVITTLQIPSTVMLEPTGEFTLPFIDNGVNYTVNGGCVQVDKGKLKAISNGDTTVTATYKGANVSFRVIVADYCWFELNEGVSNEADIPNDYVGTVKSVKVTLANNDFGSFKIQILDSEGNILARKEDIYYNNSAEIEISSYPTASKIRVTDLSDKKLGKIEIQVPRSGVQESSQETQQNLNTLNLKIGAGLSASALSKTLKMKAGSKSNNEIVRIYSTGPSTIKMDATFDADGYQIYEVKYTDIIGSDHFAKVISNLLSTDANDNSYYYTVEELLIGDKSPSNLGYTTAYKFLDDDTTTWNSINAANANDASVLIRNSKSTDDSVDLPTSGGNGTAPYRNAGFLLMLTAVTFPYIKHRNRRKRNSA